MRIDSKYIPWVELQSGDGESIIVPAGKIAAILVNGQDGWTGQWVDVYIEGRRFNVRSKRDEVLDLIEAAYDRKYMR